MRHFILSTGHIVFRKSVVVVVAAAVNVVDEASAASWLKVIAANSDLWVLRENVATAATADSRLVEEDEKNSSVK